MDESENCSLAQKTYTGKFIKRFYDYFCTSQNYNNDKIVY